MEWNAKQDQRLLYLGFRHKITPEECQMIASTITGKPSIEEVQERVEHLKKMAKAAREEAGIKEDPVSDNGGPDDEDEAADGRVKATSVPVGSGEGVGMA